MATWRKVIVSGSTANLANVQVDGLTSGVVTGAAGNLTTTAINGTGNIVATTGASGLVHSGSFSGSFQGDGSILSGVFATAIFPTTERTDITSGNKFFISQSTGQEFITYGNLLTDLAGTNLVTQSNDSLTLASQISVTGVSASFLGNLTGTATTASFVTTAQTASYVLQAVSASFATLAQTANTASYVITAQTASYVLQAVSASFATNAANATNATNATTATNVTVTDTTSGGTHFLTFTTGSSGAQTLRVDSNGPTVNPSQNSISATSFTGSLQGTATSASYVLQAASASFATLAQTANTASYVITAQTASYVHGNIFTSTNPATSASYALSSSFASTSPAGNLTGNALPVGVTNSSLTSLGTIGSLTATNATITNNLTVQGTASFQHTTNLEVADRFVLFASGSTSIGDGGIVVQQVSQSVGELYGYDSGTNRWAFTSSFTANQAAFTPAAYITTTEFAASNPSAAPLYGSSSFGFGNIHVNSLTGDIFIYS
jgi:hypothetical protein